MFLETVLQASLCDIAKIVVESLGIDGGVNHFDFVFIYTIKFGHFVFHQGRMCHDFFGSLVVGAIAAYGEFI